MSNVKWFKHYVGMATDDKFKKIRRRVGLKHYALFKMWSIVLERATTDGGWFREGENVAHDQESLDVVFEEMVDDYGQEIIDLFFGEMIRERLLTKDLLGFYSVTNWEEYQHASLSTPRVQEHRENKKLEDDVTDIVQEFNKITGKSYRSKTESYRSKIRGRFNDGYTREDMLAVIRHKQRDWVGTKHEKFLTPDTIFRPGHFDRYLNEIPKDTKRAMDEGSLIKVRNIYGHQSFITQQQFDAAEAGFFKIVK